MGITKYGTDVVAKSVVIAAVVLAVTFGLVRVSVVRYGAAAAVVVVMAFVLNFFRDPELTPPGKEGVVVSPADGRVVVVREMFEKEYLRQDAVQISIFMSPLDVHVNRIPVSGTVTYYKHIPGRFGVAFRDKSSEENERTHIGIERRNLKVFISQISGAVARRIVSEVRIGQQVRIGDRFGMIKFGSRVDVLVPKTMAVTVKLNDRVLAGESVLAELS